MSLGSTEEANDEVVVADDAPSHARFQQLQQEIDTLRHRVSTIEHAGGLPIHEHTTPTNMVGGNGGYMYGGGGGHMYGGGPVMAQPQWGGSYPCQYQPTSAGNASHWQSAPPTPAPDGNAYHWQSAPPAPQPAPPADNTQTQ